MCLIYLVAPLATTVCSVISTNRLFLVLLLNDRNKINNATFGRIYIKYIQLSCGNKTDRVLCIDD